MGRWRGRRRIPRPWYVDGVCSDGVPDILEFDQAHVSGRRVGLALDLVEHLTGYANAAGVGKLLQTSSDIDTITVDVVSLIDDVAEIYPNSQDDLPLGRERRISVPHLLLNAYRAIDRVHNARKFDENAIPQEFDDPAATFSNKRCDDRFTSLSDCMQSSGLVYPHHAGIADDIRDDDGSQATVDPAGRRRLSHLLTNVSD
jgi:hypothetical protein